MIFYFSATGNSKHVAMSLAKEDERVILITDCISEKNFSFDVSKEECVGIISPTYNWTMPNLVSGFLRHLELKYDKKPYIYYVGTFGTTTGAAAVMANKLLEQKGISFDAFYDVKMPDTWTPIFDLSDKNKVAKINENAAVQIRSIKKHIDNRFKGKYMHITTPYVTGLIGKKIYDNYSRKTANLSVNDDCIGCGLCAVKCPAHAIEIRDKKPVWVKERCTMCLGCLHRCPKFAIECGKNTHKHGQYLNPYEKI